MHEYSEYCQMPTNFGRIYVGAQLRMRWMRQTFKYTSLQNSLTSASVGLYTCFISNPLHQLDIFSNLILLPLETVGIFINKYCCYTDSKAAVYGYAQKTNFKYCEFCLRILNQGCTLLTEEAEGKIWHVRIVRVSLYLTISGGSRNL